MRREPLSDSQLASLRLLPHTDLGLAAPALGTRNDDQVRSEVGWRSLAIVAAAIQRFDYVQLVASYDANVDEPPLAPNRLLFSLQGWNGDGHSLLADALDEIQKMFK